MTTSQAAALSGMLYHPGKTVEHWERLTGVRPAYPVRIRNGICEWTAEAERLAQQEFSRVAFLNAMLTGRLAE